MNSEITFHATADITGGFFAQAVGHAIITEADDVAALQVATRDAVEAHFHGQQVPRIVHLRMSHDSMCTDQ